MSKTKNGAALSATDKFLWWLSWALLVAGAVVSAKLNAVHATRVHDTVAFHVAVPLVALFAGLYAELIFMSTHPRAVRWTAGAAVLIGFVFAMASSYVSILAVVQEDMKAAPGWMQKGTAALPDAVMIIAVTVLLSHRWRTSRTADVTEADRQPNRFKRLTGKAMDKVEARLDKPTPEPVTVSERPAPDRPTAPVTVPEAGVHGVHSPEALRSVTDRPTVRVPEPEAVAATDRHRTEAGELIARTGKRQSVEKVARVLEALDDEIPVSTIGETQRMGERTVREIRDARLPLAHRSLEAVS